MVTFAEILEPNPDPHIPDYVSRRLAGAYRDRPIISDPERGDIAPTCVAHYAKDLSTRLVADKRFPRGVRPYTVREYARLQGVPDTFSFVGSDNDAYRMIGNGVSVCRLENGSVRRSCGISNSRILLKVSGDVISLSRFL